VKAAVEWGRAHQNLDGITAIGVDEIAIQKGHKYLTVVYQINEGCRRLLWVGRERKEETLESFFDWFGSTRSAALSFVASDMWKPYLNVIKGRASKALHVLDRFHIMSHLSKAIDEVRSTESKDLKAKGLEPVLKKSRWLLLKRPENLTKSQEVKLSALVKYNLKSVRSYLLKEDFQSFWEYVSPTAANRFLDRWTTCVMRSKLEPMKKVARMLRSHQPLILNWFRAKGAISSGAVEGLNNKAKVTTRRSYGFKNPDVAQIALYHALGKLPEPERTHIFC
jgi:transposase